MSAQTTSYLEIISHLPADTVVVFNDVDWQEYEQLLNEVGEERGLRISYCDGTLTAMTLSPEHESYSDFIKALVTTLRLRLRVNIRFFGSATMKKKKRGKGGEPDACFYVQSVAVIGNKIQLDFEKDPPPDIAVEVDIHHDSRSKYPIYADLGVPELWRFDGEHLTIHLLENDTYIEVENSRALPMLSGRVLTEYLGRLRTDGEFNALIAFDEWLQSNMKRP